MVPDLGYIKCLFVCVRKRPKEYDTTQTHSHPTDSGIPAA